MAKLGDYKKKRTKIGRPKELEAIMRRLDQGLITTIDRAQSDLPMAYQAIHDVLVAKDSSPTNKFSAAKWIIEFNEKSFKMLIVPAFRRSFRQPARAPVHGAGRE